MTPSLSVQDGFQQTALVGDMAMVPWRTSATMSASAVSAQSATAPARGEGCSDLMWLEDLYAHVARGQGALATDLLASRLSELLSEGELDPIGSVLFTLDLSRVEPEQLLAAVWSLVDASAHLAGWRWFFEQVSRALDAYQDAPAWRTLLHEPQRPRLGQRMSSALGAALEAIVKPSPLTAAEQLLATAVTAPGEVDADGWVATLVADPSRLASIPVMDAAYDALDEALLAGHFRWCDEALAELTRRCESTQAWAELLVGVLTITATAAHRLKHRDALREKTRGILSHIAPTEVDATLRGL